MPKVDGLGWARMPTQIPATDADIVYTPADATLAVGDGLVTGVERAVWEFEVSGYRVVRKWLGFRTAKGVGRAATTPKPLDRIRPTAWLAEWNTELLDLLRILTLTVHQAGEQAELLDTICDGPLIGGDELPAPEPWQAKVPATLPRTPPQDSLPV